MSDGAHTKYMLTTVDNPFNPFTDFPAWLSFDYAHGHDTSGFLARVLITSNELSEVDQELELNRALDMIISENVSGLYRKVSSESWPNSA